MAAVITNNQINGIRSSVFTEFQTLITHIGTGDDDTAFDVSDTTLGNETYREVTFREAERGDLVLFTLFMDSTENNGNDIDEAGTFNQASGGTMYFRDITNNIAKDSTKNVFVEFALKLNFT